MTVGTRLGPYELRALIGAGGMGEVYRAYDSRLQRTVAIKVLPPGAATPERLRRFEQEAQAASALNHPNILTIHDVGREGDIAYVAMEWIEGQTLRSLLSGPRLPMRRVVDVAAQIADGLAKAHAAGIVHRDIKPENVMVSDDGFVKIVDFGLATLSAEASDQTKAPVADRTRTVTGLAGTVGYMSPEQASGQPVDHRSDQFALGVLLYEMATRTRPFERATVAQSLTATIETDPGPVESVNPDVPARLSAVIRRCLAKAPADRYESTRDLARDLRGALDQAQDLARGSAANRRARAPWYRTGAAAMLAVFTLALLAWRTSVATSPTTEPPSLAVRRFQLLSAAGDNSYDLGAGISDDIHRRLSRIAGLRLLGRSSLRDTSRLTAEFGVHAVVDGNVRVDGPRVRIEARLVEPKHGTAVWATVYERDTTSVLSVPADVALHVAQALRAPVTASEQSRITRPLTLNLEAFELFLRYRGARAGWTDRATYYAQFEPLRKALALDPGFAEAQSWLAYDLALMGDIFDGVDAYVAEGVTHAEEALRHDPASSKAHNAIAVAYLLRGAAAQARLSLQRGIALDPNDLSGMFNLSLLDVHYGRFAIGLEWARQGFARSGRYGNDYYHVAAPLAGLRDDDQSLRWLRRGESQYPTHPRLQQELALLAVLTGRVGDALAHARRAVEQGPADNPEAVIARAEIAYLVEAQDLETLSEPLMKESAGKRLWLGPTARVLYAHALAKRGETKRAAALLGEAERLAIQRIDAGDERPYWRIELATIAALERQGAVALDWLSRGYDTGYRQYGILERDPAFATLRAHPRFLALLDAMRRDVAAQRQSALERGLLDFDELIGVRPESVTSR